MNASGEVVGRIAAIINRSHNQYYKDHVGFFGFFDCINDPEVARLLTETVRERLKRAGFAVMRGPYNPSVNDECGVLVEGFDSSPFVMMTYNPPYYLDLYDQSGFKQAKDLYAFYMSGREAVPGRIERIVDRVKRQSGFTIRNIDLKRLSDEMKIIQGLYNETLDRNWGFVPVTHEDLEFAAEDLKQIADPSLILIAEKDGVAVGFSLCIPNINEFLWQARASSGLWRVLKVAWALKTRRPKEARLAILGVRPEFRNTGIAALFYYESLVRGGKKYIGGELSWVEESNKEIIHAITVMGGKKYKCYRIYEQAIQS